MKSSITKSVCAATFGVIGLAALAAGNAWAGETDPTKILNTPAMTLPDGGSTYIDPVFGSSITRVADPASLNQKELRPEYSQLQAWNADGSLLLLNSGLILDAKTYRIVHKIDYRWPGFGHALRWSPVDPLKLYYTGGDLDGCGNAGFYEYTLTLGSTVTGTPKLVKCFPEYESLYKDQSFEEISDDGRIVALVGKKKTTANSWGYVNEAFAFEIPTAVKHRPLELPIDSQWGPLTGDFAAASPSGKYILIQFASGTARYRGLEAFDLEMNYVGKVHTGSGHGDLVRDANGVEWAVIDNANNAYLYSGNRYIVKARIPSGVIFDAAGNVDANATGAAGLTVRLLVVDWYSHMHISCRGVGDPTWCAFGTYITQEGFNNGVQAFENEIVKVYLDSTYLAPKIERLAHHRTAPYALAGRDNCTDRSNYWAQPHATISPNGQKIVFGSNWGRVCDTNNPVDAFVIDVSSGTSVVRPMPPKDLVVH